MWYPNIIKLKTFHLNSQDLLFTQIDFGCENTERLAAHIRVHLVHFLFQIEMMEEHVRNSRKFYLNPPLFTLSPRKQLATRMSGMQQ